jgi:hypothetical protein
MAAELAIHKTSRSRWMSLFTQDELNRTWDAINAGAFGVDPFVIAPRRINSEAGTDIMSIPSSNGSDVSVYERKSGDEWHEVTYRWPQWPIVQSALENDRYKWRTVEGLVKETGLDAVTIVGSMSANDAVVLRSSIPDKTGRDLFTTKDHYKEKSSYWERLQSVITNKVSK